MSQVFFGLPLGKTIPPYFHMVSTVTVKQYLSVVSGTRSLANSPCPEVPSTRYRNKPQSSDNCETLKKVKSTFAFIGRTKKVFTQDIFITFNFGAAPYGVWGLEFPDQGWNPCPQQ